MGFNSGFKGLTLFVTYASEGQIISFKFSVSLLGALTAWYGG